MLIALLDVEKEYNYISHKHTTHTHACVRACVRACVCVCAYYIQRKNTRTYTTRTQQQQEQQLLN